MPSEENKRDEDAKKPGAEQRQGTDFSKYRMNPVQVEESEEAARALPRRIGVAFVILAVIAVGVMGVMVWNRLNAQRSPLESPDPAVRERAQELVDNILTRIASLQGYVYDVTYPTSTELHIFINPTVLDESKAERSVNDDEIETATKRVTEEFRGYGPHGRALMVKAYVAEHPLQADEEAPVAIGTYDPETDAIRVQLTPSISVPSGTGTGEAPPGQGHIGERPGAEMPEAQRH